MLPSLFLRLIYRPLHQFVYPPVCFVCQSLLNEGERKVCDKCWNMIAPIRPADALYQEMVSRLCSSRHIDGLVSSYLFEKEGTLQTLVHELKYSGMTSLGVELGKRLGERICTDVEVSQIAGMIAVPLHPMKRRERGYNQSEWICEGIHSVTGLKSFHRALKRVRYTKSQTQFSVNERRENVSGAFMLDQSYQNAIRDGAFLIVDDVITTGATMEACADTLARSGVRSILACSVALADRSMLP